MTADSGHGLLIFDGDCGFCTSAARFGQRFCGLERVEAWQFADLESLGVTPEQCATAVQWVAADGTISSGSDAIASALRAGGQRGWQVVGRALALPGIRQLANVGYRLTARYRHRLPGGTAACKLPS